ncbi:MAG: hypothetical protein DRN04_03370 [Thermoprotei archaeon]|nr:MAG: hypothetical protein DRN04_03370 [Thermoprotei archaeon]
MKIDKLKVSLAIAYMISMVILVFKMASPLNIQIIVHGEREVYVKEIPRVYTFSDMLIITVSSIVMSSCAVSLILLSILKSEIKAKQSSTVRSLSKSEKKVYDFLLSKGGVAFQSEIVETLNLSRSTVSIILDKLEAKGLVERRRRGMSNIVIVKH